MLFGFVIGHGVITIIWLLLLVHSHFRIYFVQSADVVHWESHDLATSGNVASRLDKYGTLRLLLTLQFNQASCRRQNAQGHVTNKTVGVR